jgi:peptidoglycan/LPS O-acetylase OafA/YrhL
MNYDAKQRSCALKREQSQHHDLQGFQALNYSDFKSTSHFPGLDGIRGLAVLGTIVAHSPNPQIWDGLNGQAGVTVFFVLSGFLITTLALREEARYGYFSFTAFIIRRSFRLFPAYYAVLSLYCLLILWLKVPVNGSIEDFKKSLIYLVFYMQEYAHLDHFYQTWSLGVEEKFYIVWPMIAFVIFHNAHRRWLWAFSIPLALILTLSLGWDMIKPLPYFALLMGSFSAVLLDSQSTYGKVKGVLHRIRVPCVLGLIVCHFVSVTVPTFLALSSVFMTLVLMIILTGGLPRFVSFLEHPWLVRLGMYSYFIYLIHLLAKGVVVKIQPLAGSERFDSFVTIILTTLLSCAVASASSRYFEQPLTDLGRKISDRVRRDRSTA